MSTQVYESFHPSKKIRNSYHIQSINWNKCARTLKQWQHNYRSRKALLKLSDEQLVDIGLRREQAHKEASRAFWVISRALV